MSKKISFPQLKKLWYDKLKESGFKDIENDKEGLQNYVSARKNLDRNPPEVAQAKFEYYNMAIHFLNDFTFESVRQRNIWEYHANGVSTRNIAKIFNEIVGSEPTNHVRISWIIKDLRRKMMKMYMPTWHHKENP